MSTVGVAGHQVLPAEAVGYIRNALREFLSAGLFDAGCSALAAGADQYFAEALLAAGARLEAVLPCHGYEATFDETHLPAYRRLLARADKVTTCAFDEPSEKAFWAAGRAIVQRSDVLVAIWDGGPARGPGGTGDAVRYAESHEIPVHRIWPPGIHRPS